MGYKTEKFLGPKLFSLKSRFIVDQYWIMRLQSVQDLGNHKTVIGRRSLLVSLNVSFLFQFVLSLQYT